jgi:putative hydrolase of the HAD superfamily
MCAQAVTFDFGQTLCELDTVLLSRRLAERGVEAAPERLQQGLDDGWRAYDAAIAAGQGGHPWKTFMRRTLESAGAKAAERSAVGWLDDAVDWLWTEQPRQNLWRRPIAGMIEVCRDLRAAGVPVGLLSNSEGRLAELVAEIGWADDLVVIADSGRQGIEKPDPAIFAWTAARLGATVADIVHVGDSWGADVEGARRAGMRAIWFRGRDGRAVPEGVVRAGGPAEVRAALAAWQIP